MKKVSWLTTLAGAVAAVGVVLTNNSNPTLHVVGVVLTALAAVAGGAAAKDYNVTGNGTDKDNGTAQ
jgi:drug/metabolite transporter (DMT)-like permease